MQYNQPYGMPPEVNYGDTPYINGNPATGTQGSIPPAASIEYPQREIVNLIRDAALLTPSNADLHQLSRSVQSNLLYSDDDAGTTNQYQVTQTPAPTAYFKYQTVVCRIGNTNTGASTLNLNGLGPKPIRHPADNSELSAGELRQNAIACFIFDGAIFHLVWSSGGAVAGSAGGAPIYLTANRDFYVNGSTGDDTNYDGSAAAFAAPNHGPFKTLQRAAKEVVKYNMNGYNLTVHVAAGTYGNTVSPNMQVPAGQGVLVVQGAGSASTILQGNSCSSIQVTGPGACDLSGFKFISNGSNAADPCTGVFTAYGRTYLHDVEFGQCTGYQIGVSRSASMVLSGNLTMSGGSSGNPYASAAHLQVFFSATIETSPSIAPLYYTATVALSIGTFVTSTQQGTVALTWTSFAGFGNINGYKYFASLNGVINSSGGGVNYYPGNLAGSTSSGGQYA